MCAWLFVYKCKRIYIVVEDRTLHPVLAWGFLAEHPFITYRKPMAIRHPLVLRGNKNHHFFQIASALWVPGIADELARDLLLWRPRRRSVAYETCTRGVALAYLEYGFHA